MMHYIIVLTPIADPLGRPVAVRLRAALKRLLRCYALRCIRVTEREGESDE